MLAELDRCTRRHPGPIGQPTGGLQHQIVGLARQRTGKRPIELQRQSVGGPRLDPVAEIDESHQRIEQVVTVAAATDDVQPEIDLGMGRLHRRGLGRRAPQPPCLASAGFS
jgi:hypothetical protein